MKFHKKTLKNGLRIITVPMKDSATATVMVLVSTGSDYETDDIAGISHFLEHMCFKGTTKRPKAGDISKELDSIGAQSNAFTGKEYTGYYAKAHYKKLPQIVDVVADIYQNPTFPESEIEKEKGVVIEELHMYEDMPQSKVGEVFENLLYPNQPAGRPIIGFEKTVRSITRDQLVEYRKKHYVTNSSVIIVAGNIDQKQTEKLLEKAFAEVHASKKINKQKTKESQKVPQIKVHFKDTDQAHIIIGFRSFNIKHKDVQAAAVLETVLGRGMSSRLFLKMREELGICYYVRSSNDLSTDRGVFGISAGVAKDRIKEAIAGILEELKQIRTSSIPEQELKKAQEFKIGNMYLGLESSDSYADFFAFQDIHDLDIKTPQAEAAEIQKVTAKDVLRVAKKLFKKENISLAIVGPYKEDKNKAEIAEFKKLLETF